jgi:hypothetical protein
LLACPTSSLFQELVLPLGELDVLHDIIHQHCALKGGVICAADFHYQISKRDGVGAERRHTENNEMLTIAEFNDSASEHGAALEIESERRLFLKDRRRLLI